MTSRKRQMACVMPLSLVVSVVALHLLSAPDARGPRLRFTEVPDASLWSIRGLSMDS